MPEAPDIPMPVNVRAAIERQRAAHQRMNASAETFEGLVGDPPDGTPSEDHAQARSDARTAFQAASDEYEAATRDLEDLEHVIAQRSRMPRDLPTGDNLATDVENRVKVGREGRTYRVDGRYSYFRDLAVCQGKGSEGNPTEARERLIRNNREYAEQRAGVNQTATSGGEFVPPIWYVEQYAALLRAGRPFLDALGTKPLPADTNSLNFPKITTGSTVAVQTDGGAVSNQDLVTTSVTAQVQTEAGRTVASYQFVDLSPVSDLIIMQDLTFAYNTQLDKDALTGNVTNAKGLLNTTSVNSVTYTDATPTGSEFYAPTAQSASQIAKNAFVPTDFGVTHPSVWYNILSGLDGNLRPLYLIVGPGFNAAGDGSATDSGNGVVGNIGGIPICIDANMPTNLGGGTNESRLAFVNRMGFDFWERGPIFKVADQTSITTLQYQFVAYGYYAVTSRQPKMISVVSGTGLIPVTGF